MMSSQIISVDQVHGDVKLLHDLRLEVGFGEPLGHGRRW
jgi:hypothetical protein